ncbi:glycoside hydrolase family 16 protein [Leucobacter sp. G161]|uniref:glycoside hydrolase family 16 protein n=1 Tax=Leucobacter sp. G161 TaxID=663704 RepID=UPI00073BAA80|nr:glycoside hydrolase family 16 protein [Leucobacter sp. G161]KUF06071.1 hypothetical protein AUL38_14325 [Leucobacter sp. G161]
MGSRNATQAVRTRRGVALMIAGAIALSACSLAAGQGPSPIDRSTVENLSQHSHSQPVTAAKNSVTKMTLQTQDSISAEVVTGDDIWSTVFFDDFDRNSLGADWSAYTGRPSSDPRTWWDPTMVWLSNGSLVLAGAPSTGHTNLWRTGAVSNWKAAQTYGKWEVRLRTHASQVLSYHFLLWPQAESWPPEIDIAEGYSRERTNSQSFLHWVDESGTRRQTSFSVNGNFSEWNTVAVEWTPNAVRFFLNGQAYGEATGLAVPHEPMFLALQTETRLAASLQGQSRQTQFVWIDWVRISALDSQELA